MRLIFVNLVIILTEMTEYCETEVFQPHCGTNQMIVMTSALYGRMEIGRCVKKNLGYIGCYKSVLELMDQRCSGQSSCKVRIPDPDLDNTKPCLEELKTYLQAQYMCVTGKNKLNTCVLQVKTSSIHVCYR